MGSHAHGGGGGSSGSAGNSETDTATLEGRRPGSMKTMRHAAWALLASSGQRPSERCASTAVDEELVLTRQTALAPAAVKAPGVGVTLDGLAGILRSLGVACTAERARGSAHGASGPHTLAAEEMGAQREGLQRLRDALRRAPACAVLLNYHMGTAGQRPFGGHFSPAAAYHEASGRFLVLDVWPKTSGGTGPCWLSGSRLWAALASTDPDTGLSRGWLVADME